METKDRILLLGATGFLGEQIAKLAPTTIDLILAYHKKLPVFSDFATVKIDLTGLDDLKKKLKKIKPSVIIHAARIGTQDSDEKTARKITSHLAQFAKDTNSRLIYISSDAVFDGKKGNYQESDRPNPLTQYGQAKLAAETAIKKILKNNYIIIRPSYIYSNDLKNPDKRTIDLLAEIKKSGTIVRATNMYRSPTLVTDLARAIWRLLDTDFSGTIHVAGKKQSIYEFSRRILKQHKLNPRLIQPTQVPKHQKNVALDTSVNTTLLKEPHSRKQH